MERIGVLINKLQELYQQQASSDQLLHTTQMLQTELFLMKQQQHNSGKKMVAVMMPANITPVNPAEDIQKSIETGAIGTSVPGTEAQQEEVNNNVIAEDVSAAPGQGTAPVEKKQFNVFEEVPTLAHQTKVRELNEVMVSEGLSLNERLSKPQGELGEKLHGGAVKDIKKAISLNDRYIYIRELFRGDEIMYERSLKTINQFSIYPEAEFWIQRELKLKLGWQDDHPLVKQFDQLVKRRFL